MSRAGTVGRPVVAGSLFAAHTPNNTDKVQALEREVEAARHR